MSRRSFPRQIGLLRVLRRHRVVTALVTALVAALVAALVLPSLPSIYRQYGLAGT